MGDDSAGHVLHHKCPAPSSTDTRGPTKRSSQSSPLDPVMPLLVHLTRCALALYPELSGEPKEKTHSSWMDLRQVNSLRGYDSASSIWFVDCFWGCDSLVLKNLAMSRVVLRPGARQCLRHTKPCMFTTLYGGSPNNPQSKK